jgi:drug/metabolite transporter (DMT)-like permease
MVIKEGLAYLPPLRFAGLRMLIATVVLTPLASRRGGLRLDRRSWSNVAIGGLIQNTLPFALMFPAQQWVPAGLSAMLFASFPVWMVLSARVVLGEALTGRKWAAAALGLSGIAALQWPSLGGLDVSRNLALGSGLIVFAAILVAFGSMFVRRTQSHVPPATLAWGQTVGSTVVLLALSALIEPAPSVWRPAAWAALLYLAIFCTALTYVLLFWLFPRVSATALGVIPLCDTTVAVFLATLILHEPLSARMGLGGAMVLGAAALAATAGDARLAESMP